MSITTKTNLDLNYLIIQRLSSFLANLISFFTLLIFLYRRLGQKIYCQSVKRNNIIYQACCLCCLLDKRNLLLFFTAVIYNNTFYYALIAAFTKVEVRESLPAKHYLYRYTQPPDQRPANFNQRRGLFV